MNKPFLLSIFLIGFLANCATTSNVGPQYQSSSANSSQSIPENTEPFDISIAMFDPGISKQDSYGADGVWPGITKGRVYVYGCATKGYSSKDRKIWCG